MRQIGESMIVINKEIALETSKQWDVHLPFGFIKFKTVWKQFSHLCRFLLNAIWFLVLIISFQHKTQDADTYSNLSVEKLDQPSGQIYVQSPITKNTRTISLDVVLHNLLQNVR